MAKKEERQYSPGDITSDDKQEERARVATDQPENNPQDIPPPQVHYPSDVTPEGNPLIAETVEPAHRDPVVVEDLSLHPRAETLPGWKVVHLSDPSPAVVTEHTIQHGQGILAGNDGFFDVNVRLPGGNLAFSIKVPNIVGSRPGTAPTQDEFSDILLDALKKKYGRSEVLK